MKIKQKGFTLIELLVVIAIIGLLSTMAVVSLNSARAKARDAKRLNDVKQMANILSIQATEGTGKVALEGCTADGANVTSCTGPGEVAQFDKFIDPSADATKCNKVGTGCTMCAAIGSTVGCQYAVTGTLNVEEAKIIFYLENASGGLTGETVHTINASGVFDPS